MINALIGCLGDETCIDDRRVVSKSLEVSALNFARTGVSDPYFWGGKGPDSFDCSGLISWSYMTADSSILFETQVEDPVFGNGLSPDVAMQDFYDRNILHVDRFRGRSGDIVFITPDSGRISHRGLFIKWIGSDKFSFINASLITIRWS